MPRRDHDIALMLAFEAYEALPEAEKYVGQGRFGSVKKVKRVSDSRVLACKSIRFQDGETSKTTVERECDILSTLDHPNVIKQVDVRWKPHKAMIYMEYCEGGSLQDLINERASIKTSISEQYIWNVFFQLASALLYCHLGLQVDNMGRVSTDRRGIAHWNPVLHRDIKPGNVFLFSRSETALDCVRLGDFGLGYVLQSDTAPETYAGTAQYLAPEINRTSTRSIHWTEHCDIFSLGCTIYALCMFKPPFSYHMESESESYEPVPERYSDQLRACIASCLSYYPQTRPNALRLFQQSQRRIECFRPRAAETAAPVETMDDLVAQPSASGGSSAKSKKKKNRKTRTIKSNSMTNEVFEHKVSPGTAIDLALPAGAIQDLPNNVLREAVVNGDADLTKKALEMEGANPNATTTDPSCVPMLSLATDARHDQVVKLLIDAGADVNQGSGDKSKALHRAAKHNRRGILQALLENGVSVNETDNLGRTALSYAAEEGHTDAVRLLLNADVDPNSEDFDKRTPLHWAALKGHVVIVSLLTAAGARKPHKDISGLTAETLAREAGKYTVARLLSSTTPPLDRGQNISAAATSAALPLSSEVSKKLRLNDLKKFSENFKLLTSVPKDLIPILLNDRSKQEEIDRLNKRKDWKTGMPLAQYDTKPWVHNPKLNTSVQPLPKTKNHSKQFQRLPEDPAIVRVRLPPSSGDRSEEMVHVPHNQRRLESNVAAVRPEDGIVSPSGYSPPVRVTWSQIASRGTVHDVHRAAK